VNVWNSLPQNVIEAKTLSDFKKTLDLSLGAEGIKGYGGREDQYVEFDDQP